VGDLLAGKVTPDHAIDLTLRDVCVQQWNSSTVMQSQSIKCKGFQYIYLINLYIKMLHCNYNLLATF